MLDALKFDEKGLIPAVIQCADTGKVLTLCYMNREALEKSLETGLVHVFRRSKGALMRKGGTSGHTQQIVEVRVDCEGNSLLFLVKQKVAACHAGYYTCYYRKAAGGRLEICEERVFDPDKVYRASG